MFKILSSDNNKILYLVTINKTPFTISVSTSGELLDIKPYMDKNKIESSSNSRKIEFG